jgi:hypothetical protein
MVMLLLFTLYLLTVPGFDLLVHPEPLDVVIDLQPLIFKSVLVFKLGPFLSGVHLDFSVPFFSRLLSIPFNLVSVDVC